MKSRKSLINNQFQVDRLIPAAVILMVLAGGVNVIFSRHVRATGFWVILVIFAGS